MVNIKKENPATRGTDFTASNEQYDQLIQFAELRQSPFDTKRRKLPPRSDDIDAIDILNHPRVNPPQGGSPTAQKGVPPTGGSPTTQSKKGPPTGGPSHHHYRHGMAKASSMPHGHNAGNLHNNFKAGAPLQVRW